LPNLILSGILLAWSSPGALIKQVKGQGRLQLKAIEKWGTYNPRK
jgi:hypothetical protein